MTQESLGASFRDLSGFMFRHNDVLYRQVNISYKENFDVLHSSGLYDKLIQAGRLVEHAEVPLESVELEDQASVYKVIQPTLIPYVSYPYEWCFSQLKDAALLTLQVQKDALRHGMSLKDASAYNVQFIGSRPTFIDTLSFEAYEEGKPWIAYRQFCQHFLGPLAIMANCDVRLRELLKSNIDGIPLDLASRILPRSSYLRYSLLTHIHLHAFSQRQHSDDGRDPDSLKQPRSISKTMLLALIESLASAVKKCRLPKMDTEWGGYYGDTNYSSDGMTAKEKMVKTFVDRFVGDTVTIHDVGANTGRFSHLVSTAERYVLSHDIDELAVERHYLANRAAKVERVLPLVQNLSNPTPAIGWALNERESLVERMQHDAVMALALIHHLAISNNIPLPKIARFFHQVADRLIIEFVPKEDSQVRRLLATREDIFPDYNIAGFEASLDGCFKILDKKTIEDTERTLYVLEAI